MNISMPDIIYIVGPGRCGTTILGILLANNTDIFGVGELAHLFKDGFIRDVTCSCGKPTSKCDIWKVVRQRCNWHQDKIPAMANLLRSVEWHSKFPLLAMNLVSSWTLRKYRDVNQQLFQAVESVSVNSVVVDSSKYAGRALALSKVFPGKVWVICLTRSPAGIISSFQKTDAAEQKPKSLFSIVVYYLYVITCLRVVAWRLGARVLQMKYEQLLADPRGTLAKIEKWCGFDLSSVRQKLEEDAWFKVGHIITGNRLRRAGRVQFRPNMDMACIRGFGPRLAMLIMNIWRIALRL